MNKFTVLLLSSLGCLYGNPFQSTLQHEISWLKEETFVISASKVKENIDKTPASTYVITDTMIENMGALTLTDILKTVPGINITQSNIYNNKISVRGIQSNTSEKVLILLDGHSLNSDLLNGGATGAYKTLPLEIIKRVEIVKSPASSLYGENAFMALINIITKKADDIDGSKVYTTFGSNNTKSANLLHSIKNNTKSIVINLKTEKSDGKSVFVKNDEINKSGYTNPYLSSTSAYLSIIDDIGYYIKGNISKIEDGSNYGASHVLNKYDLSKRYSYFLELGYKNKIATNSDIHLRTYYDNYKIENRWEVNTNRIAYVGYKNEKTGLEAILKTKTDRYAIVSGISSEQQKIKKPWQKMNWNPTQENPFTTTSSYDIIDYSDSNSNFISEVDRKFFAFYNEFIYHINNDLRLNLGIRYDKYDDFGDTLNPRLGLTWKINDNNNLKISYAEAFRAPTFAELYSKNNPYTQGNKNLKPERIKTTEITFENASINNIKLSSTLFNTNIKDLIVLENTIQKNQNHINTKGVELGLVYSLPRGSYLTANYTHKKVINKTINDNLPDISQNTAFIAFNKRLNRYLNIYMDMQYTGSQNRLNTDTRSKVPSSIINNATLLIKNFKSKNLSLRLSAYNIFNTTTYDSAEKFDYPISGRSYISELTYKF